MLYKDDGHRFQSTLPHGERLIESFRDVVPLNVSIHAPTWGATPQMFPHIPRMKFQSTLPHGERLF